MSVPGAKVPTARILVVGVCGIGVLNCGFSPSVCSATVTSLFRRGVARWTPCHEAQRIANAAAIFLIYEQFGVEHFIADSPCHAMTYFARSVSVLPMASGFTVSSSTGTLKRLTQKVLYPNALAPAASQPPNAANMMF